MLSQKLLVRLLVIGLLVFVLVGVVGAAAKPYEIKWWFPSNGPQKDVALIEAELNKTLIPKLNATIKINCLDFGTYATKLPVMLASGEQFDICFITSWTTPSYRDAVNKGYLRDITEDFPKYAPNTYKQLPSGFITGTKIDSKNYCVPANKELAHQWGIVYRADIAEKYGFDMSKVKKLADLEPILKTIKEKEPGMTGIQNIATESGYKAMDYDRIIGDTCPGVLYNDSRDMKIFNELETAEFRDYLDLARRWYLAGYVPADAATITNHQDMRRAGKVFAYIGGLKPYVNEEVSKSLGFPHESVALTEPWVQTRDCAGSNMAISNTSKNVPVALGFLEILNTDEQFINTFLYGIEGRHYIKVSDNVVKLPPEYTMQNTPYRAGNNWVYGNQYHTWVWEGENADKWTAYKEYNKNLNNARSLGFNFDSEPVKTQVAACNNVYNEFMPGLITGSVDPDIVLPQAIAKFKAAGLGKIIAEAQRQLDEW